MTEIDGISFDSIAEKWSLFKEGRHDNNRQDDPHFMTMREREQMIDDLIAHYKYLEIEYLILERKYEKILSKKNQ